MEIFADLQIKNKFLKMLITNLNSEHPLIYNFKVKKYVGPYDFGLVNQNKRI